MQFGKRAKGVATIELALVLVPLLLLSYPVYDFFRGMRTSLILINVSREGANLMSRTAAPDYQSLMDDLAMTTPPLDMASKGMIYITVVEGESASSNAPVENVVVEQHRWNGGAVGSYSPNSAIWNCAAGNWNRDGSCRMPNPLPVTNNMPASLSPLDAGEVVYVVDVFYEQPSLFGFGSGYVPLHFIPNQFHSQTIM